MSEKRYGTLIMMSGLPGTGKSTVAQQISAEFNPAIPIIATDAVRKELFPQPAYSDEENSAVHHEVQRRLIAQLQAGAVVIYDATNLREIYRDWVMVAQTQTACQWMIVATTAAESVVQERLVARQQRADSLSDADYAIYRLLQATAEPIVRPHHLVRTDSHYKPDLAAAIAALRVILTATQ